MSTFLRLANTQFRIRNFNNHFLLLRAENGVEVGKIGKAIFEKQFSFIDEVIVTEVEICLKLNDRFSYPKIGLLARINIETVDHQKEYKIPVYFEEHEDWQIVESTTGFSKDHVISKLTQQKFSLAMFGFLPGFLYLNDLDPSLHVPRKTVPSKYVEANSLAIGGKYLGIYGLDSPGGWNVIGKLPLSLLQIPELPPVPLNLGDQLQFESISQQEYDALLNSSSSLKSYNG